MPYKAYVKTYGDQNYNSNAVVFKTETEAENYAVDLMSRWTLVETWKVESVEEEVNYIFTNKAERIHDEELERKNGYPN